MLNSPLLLKDFQIEQIIIVKKILDHDDVRNPSIVRGVKNSSKKCFGFKSTGVVQAARIIERRTTNIRMGDQAADYIKRFLDSYDSIEKTYHSKCSVSKYKIKGFDSVVKEICSTGRLDCILDKDMVTSSNI